MEYVDSDATRIDMHRHHRQTCRKIIADKGRKGRPPGGDRELGALITEGRVDFVIFFWDPREARPHHVDVKASLRIAVLYNIPMARDWSTAHLRFSLPLRKKWW